MMIASIVAFVVLFQLFPSNFGFLPLVQQQRTRRHDTSSSWFFSNKKKSVRANKNDNNNNNNNNDMVPSWDDLSSLLPNLNCKPPVTIDGKTLSSRPNNNSNNNNSNNRPILFRERHGWCPYSERVWLALETKGIDYDTVYIDNIYGRPSWYSGDTPQIAWPDGRIQSESMDLVRDIDRRYSNNNTTATTSTTNSTIPSVVLYPPDIENDVLNKIQAFNAIFPKRTRPSSRAAFLFRNDGEPLWKSEFETVLRNTNQLLANNHTNSTTSGPFFCGNRFTAADIAWAPFLERYAAQLPSLHHGLNPKCKDSYPYLYAWYQAMDNIPVYACRIKGDASSWRKVLVMAGFGNAGNVPTVISSRMNEEAIQESSPLSIQDEHSQQLLWEKYASASRPYIASSPGREAASTLLRNREYIIQDILKRQEGMKASSTTAAALQLPSDITELDTSMRALACILIHCGNTTSNTTSTTTTTTNNSSNNNQLVLNNSVIQACKKHQNVVKLASYLDERMCVPRDMGAIPAACLKRMAAGHF